MKVYKVLVVDDSAFMRKLISDLIMEDPEFEVICTASNGVEAIHMVNQFRPDVITMDIEMPIMNGLEALQIIMKELPTPVVMLSSMNESSARETMNALSLGAIDFIKKPSGSISFDMYKIKRMLHEKLKIATQSNRHHMIVNAKLPVSNITEVKTNMNERASFQHIVAIGTSTGGPRALQTVISQIPSSFPAPILIVQHMPPKFTSSLAERLNHISDIRVVEAEDGCVIKAGIAYIAPGGWHMRLTREDDSDYVIRLSREEPRNGHRPSVDILFESLIPYKELIRHTVIMTGMGSDGAKGMKALQQAGAESTIAESEETCVVYGMPRSAIEMEAAKYVLPLMDIPAQLIDLVRKES